ncbi:hypothetical protein [Bradyrhizobium jicamae]|uniref:hypothetical protein n=1 Tax=Bradyrhizobium jicamae TaxID=280332 RepID=UPI001BA548DC|nr:hypothetical protein [Bradyrhizobium jicamae]
MRSTDAAGLQHCSAHELRKASGLATAERGAAAPELCGVFGWGKLDTAEIYIREANKSKMSANAFTRLEEYRNRKSVSLSRTRSSGETIGKNTRDKSKPK